MLSAAVFQNRTVTSGEMAIGASGEASAMTLARPVRHASDLDPARRFALVRIQPHPR